MNRLRELRKEKNLTIRELGNLTNISYPTISAIENEVRPFTQEHIKDLCKFFNVSSDYLLGFSNVRNSVIDDVEIAFYNQKGVITEEQKKEIEKFIDFIKLRDQK